MSYKEQGPGPSNPFPRMMLSIGLASLFTLLLGCQRFRSSPLDPLSSATELVTKNLASVDLESFLIRMEIIERGEWPLNQWTLDSLTYAAYFFHPDLQVARVGQQLADANQTLSAQRPNPQFISLPAYNSTTTIPTPWIVAGGIDIPIETAGKRRHRRTAAAFRQEGAQLQLAATAWRIRGQVRQSFLELWAAQTAEEAQYDQFKALSQIVELLDARFQAGDVSLLEVNQAKVENERARVAHLIAKNLQNTARVQLAAAIGVSVRALVGLTFDFSPFVAELQSVPLEAAVNAALTNRADILAALAEYAATEADLHLEIARQYPNLNLSPGYNYDQSDNEWRLGLSLELPLLHQNQGAIAIAEARRIQQAARFDSLQLSILTEIELAVANFENAQVMIEAANRNLEAAQSQERLALASYQAGETSLLAVSAAGSFSAMARITSQEARVNAQRALGALELATQHPVIPTEAFQTIDPRSIQLP